ncbi:MAG: hypothetical protein ACRDFA_05595 [bacterium]
MGYFLEEKAPNESGGPLRRISLTADTEENRLVREGRSPGREGPVAITIEIFMRNPATTEEEWIRTTRASNFHLSDRKLVPYPIAGTEGLLYEWSGLYEADNIVVAKGERIFSIAVTYLTPEDDIRRDFYRVIRTLELN